ncbi:MAG: M28 family peptidase [Thermoleophilaceae bacterium]|nr:M28 family peptidase [Thermoleophilaceae bacterium]
MGLPDESYYREWVERLCEFDRTSASEGERRAAELIVAELGAAGARDARIEETDVLGNYWWPLGLMTGAAAVAGALRSRVLAIVVGVLSAIGVADDVRHDNRRFRHMLPGRRPSWNAVAEVGPADAPRTVLIVSHHDAAHSGLVFHPGLPRAIGRRFPDFWAKQKTTPGVMWAAFCGPLFVALGALLDMPRLRRTGIVLSVGHTAGMVDIGLRATVPGANDNATGCAALLGLARSFAADPPPGTRVILLSSGSEESNSEGMQGFAKKHFASLATETTRVIAIDTLGSPTLLPIEGEGMLGIWDYPRDLLAELHAHADRLGIELYTGLRFRNATDGVIALKAGYPTLSLGSADEFKIPSNYHWPSDVPENIDYGTVADGARLVEALVRATPPS